MKTKDTVIALSVCLIVFIVIGYMNKSNNESSSFYHDSNVLVNDTVKDFIENEEKLDPKLIIDDLKSKYNNTDIVALFKILNTNYTSIVPKGNDNNFYSRHLLDKKYSRLGSTFLDYRVDINNSPKLLIYGHNSSKYDMPFKILENYYDREYYEEHKYLELITSSGVKTYEIFSVYVETKDYGYYQKIKFDNKETWYKHISSLKEKSFYDTGVEINKDDKILILQTCSTHKDYLKYAKKFLLIISKEVKENETN